MQYQIMAQMKTLKWSELESKYEKKIGKVKAYYDSDLTFVEKASDLRASYRFPAMYWGSASYFVKADRILKREHKTSLVAVIRAYQKVRKKEHSLDQMINAWDEIVGDTVFTSLLRTYRTRPSREILTEF